VGTRRKTLPEPVTVASFWKNRRHDAVVVRLTTYEGFNLVDLRTHFSASDGTLKPTSKGLAIVVNRLPDLLAAVTKAHAKAIELGLLKAEPAE
jgi:transcriptional coactivator p15 (PC4)